MVDLDDTYGDESSDDSGSNSNSNKSGGSSGGSGPSNSPQPVRSEVDIDERVSNTSMGQTSAQWAKKYGDVVPEKGSSGTLKEYIQTQEEECKEFYQNMAEMAVDIAGEGAQKFTLAHHAMILNMAHNRSGIVDVLESEFDMSQSKAVEVTNKICRNAGEYKAFVKAMEKISKDGLEVQDLEEMV